MGISLTRLDPTGNDRDALIDFMTGNDFPFHMNTQPTRESVMRGIDDGAYRDEDNDSYWIDHSDAGRIGFARLEDLSEFAPLFDLRLSSEFRERGFGVPVLRAMTELVFTSMPGVTRFEGQTREDNAAMRRVFARAGWVLEAYYREAWPVHGADPVASVAYSRLRRDWTSGETTPVPWNELIG
ncbi:GNAT family N-acetyltransferase [Paramicrobacterium fandaimingii]|uniref:GNAT family N-acetyltransferase n=1 Tax=Paramicrobacterium fandaimingii TaxID=2708079 RepID=UPI0014201025|nr:GNAT family protein [Microbacterium fandaimingii]